MTIYEKKLSSQLLQRYPQITPEEMIAKLIEIGVVDATRCKVLSVREYVNSLLQQGYKKIDAMWKATEIFSCSYEYIRKCMYYYIDVNLC